MKILIIDDEKSIRLSLSLGLKTFTDKMYTASSGEEGIKLFEKHKPDILIVDINLGGISGLKVLEKVRSKNKKCIIIMITYISEVKLAVEAMKLGANDYFTKPFNIQEIKKTIEDNIKYIKKSRELSKGDNKNKINLVGNSKYTLKVKEVIKKVSNIPHDTFILIQGESGTGKEVVAKSIHFNGIRKDKPYIALNCAAIPKSLQESELFGYEKGAFSDAKVHKSGLIEESNGGTLFLDEIGDMDILLQAKLLRVLQEKKFRRLGSTKEKCFAANIIAATNKNLLEEIEKGNFREDLYYRLNIIPINLKPLRERKEDVKDLIEYFIESYNNKLDKNVLGMCPEALDICINYEWKGNVRELKNFIERIMIFQENDFVEVDDLPQNVISHYSVQNTPAIKEMNLEHVEMETISRVLRENKWNITKTAQALGISRITLRRKIEKYSITK
ncbi:sigma-54-dependent transcriptional regulator [Anaeromicrobium sediminis]|uniref:Stage 0 sporulation protein A homolog n=1 Tax=Anaeromicrobium sediminis TaxID=1478221 RepID=A0A267MDF8_9FIRM|nr:sigma-54 dependent transcriptional regulator [Anaeromicrobium sediminis]PAB57621.1 hypothetical protein CCE28_18335 [Anaeromicrobium sediminis]